MYYREEGTEESKKLKRTRRESTKTEGLELSLTIEKKGQANNDTLNNKKRIKEKRSICVIARVRNRKKKIFNVIHKYLSINTTFDYRNVD